MEGVRAGGGTDVCGDATDVVSLSVVADFCLNETLRLYVTSSWSFQQYRLRGLGETMRSTTLAA